jgi:tRNA G10  N-methylase Trm11
VSTTTQRHCAKFSDALLPEIADMLKTRIPRDAEILDPFAGSGKGVDYLSGCGYDAWGIELEPEFIDSPLVQVGNALDLPFGDGAFDAIVTSPTYGNRMADKDMRDSVAGTYAKSLGRLATEGSSCHLQWGDAYRAFHVMAWREADRVLGSGGYFLLNIKDHVRQQEVQYVSDWHLGVLLGTLGYDLIDSRFVETGGLRNGQNHEARVNGEWLHLTRKERW